VELVVDKHFTFTVSVNLYHISLWMFLHLQLFERVLYIWAIRHPASGYVQGLNDLITPLFVVFLTEYISPGWCHCTYGSL